MGEKVETVKQGKTKPEKLLMLFVCFVSALSVVLSLLFFNVRNDGVTAKLASLFPHWRPHIFLFLGGLCFFSLLFAAISKIKRNSKIRPKCWLKTFAIVFTTFLLIAILGLVFDYCPCDDLQWQQIR